MIKKQKSVPKEITSPCQAESSLYKEATMVDIKTTTNLKSSRAEMLATQFPVQSQRVLGSRGQKSMGQWAMVKGRPECGPACHEPLWDRAQSEGTQSSGDPCCQKSITAPLPQDKTGIQTTSVLSGHDCCIYQIVYALIQIPKTHVVAEQSVCILGYNNGKKASLLAFPDKTVQVTIITVVNLLYLMKSLRLTFKKEKGLQTLCPLSFFGFSTDI